MSFGIKLKDLVGESNYFENEPMSLHTTFRTGGPADHYVTPDNIDKLCAVIDMCREKEYPYIINGNGSNVLYPDEGYNGVVIEIGSKISDIKIEDNKLHAQAGAALSTLSTEAAKQSLTGLEFASGIPGTIGGAVVMNAGAYGGEIKDVITGALVYDNTGKTRYIKAEDLELGYRTSIIAKQGYIVLEADFELTPGNADDIMARMKELNRKRREKQPLNLPSAGSTFKRPEGYYAAALIEECGLKGYAVGDAMVSEKHSGFVVNTGSATTHDILEVIKHVRETVYEKKGVMLETEVKIIKN